MEFVPVIVRRLLGPLSIFGPIVWWALLGLIASLNTPNGGAAIAIILDCNISTIASVPIVYYKAYIYIMTSSVSFSSLTTEITCA